MRDELSPKAEKVLTPMRLEQRQKAENRQAMGKALKQRKQP
jgi:hypothetical protein